jgi:hypothetical protein
MESRQIFNNEKKLTNFCLDCCTKALFGSRAFVRISGNNPQRDWVKPLPSPNPLKSPLKIPVTNPLERGSVVDIG